MLLHPLRTVEPVELHEGTHAHDTAGRDWSPPSRRVHILFLAGVLGMVYFVLAAVGWDFAGRPVRGTEGLISQQQMLVSLYQAFLGMTVTIATVFYAMRNHDMATLMHLQFRQSRRDVVTGAVDDLVGAVNDVAGHAAGLAARRRLARPWWSPHSLFIARPNATSCRDVSFAVAAAGRAFERIRDRAPHATDAAGAVFDIATELQQAAGRGASFAELDDIARRGHAACAALRAAAATPRQAGSGRRHPWRRKRTRHHGPGDGVRTTPCVAAPTGFEPVSPP
jgi:hypothetical protein